MRSQEKDDGVEVTVEHVAAIEHQQMLQADYGSPLEKFRRVSKLKKELDRRSLPAPFHESVKNLRNQSDVAVKTLANVS